MKTLNKWLDDNLPSSPPFMIALAVAIGLTVLGGGEPIIGLSLIAACIYCAFR